MATLSCHKFGSQGVILDVKTDPGDLPNSAVVQAYNMYVEGTNLVSRPGIKGLLTTPLSYPIWQPFPYIKSDGTEWIIFCSGPANSTTGGKIYQVASTGGTPTEILDATNGNASFNINAQAFRIAQGGSYAYMVWGSTLYRTNLASSTASAVSSLNPPVIAPAASLSNLALDSLSSTSGWSGDTIALNWAYTDLVIGSTTTKVTSALRPFMMTDVGATLAISSGTGFTPGSYVISSVAIVAGVATATLNSSCGTAHSTGGHAAIFQITTGSNYLINGQSDIEAYSGTTIHGGNDIPTGTQIGNSWTSLVNCSFNSAGGSTWAVAGVPTAYNTVAHTWINVNDPYSGVQSMPLQVPQLDSPNGYRNVNQFFLQYNYVTTDTRSLQGYTAVLTAYSDAAATQQIGVATDTFVPQYAGQQPGQAHGAVFTFPGLTTQIQSVVLQIYGAAFDVDQGVSVAYPCLANVLLAPIATGPSAQTYPNGITGWMGNSFTAQTPGILIAHGEPTSAFYGKLAGERITRDYGAGNPENWSSSSVITFSLASAPGSPLSVLQLVNAGLSMSLILRQSGSTTEYVAPLTFSSDGTYMSTDLSAYIPVTVYSAFQYLTLEFNTNLTISQSTANLFVITSISHAGNLPISQSGVAFAPITYVVEEMNNFGDATYADPLESSGSPVSNAVQPNPVYAVGQVALAAAVNSSTTAFAVYRGGGTYSDGQYRLIATVPTGSDYGAPLVLSDLVVDGTTASKVTSASYTFVLGDVGKTVYILAGSGFTPGPFTISSVSAGAATLSANAGVLGSTGGICQVGGDSLTRDLQNPYVTWNHTTRTLTDNTPDSFLNLALTYQFGRDLPPTSCNGVVSHQNRLWVWSNETVSSSWDTTTNSQNGVYFTNVDLSTDPYAEGKGITFAIAPGDNDPIVAALSGGDILLVLKGRSAAVIQGYDPTNFKCQTYLTNVGLGCSAGTAAIVCGNASRAWFKGADDVYEFSGNNTDPKGFPIQPLIAPTGFDGGPTIPTAGLGSFSMMYWNQWLFLFSPEPAGVTHPDGTAASGTQNSTCYVYDFRNGGWSQWGLPMTSGRSISGSTTGAGAFMGGYDGQLYTLGAGADQPIPNGPSYPVTWAATSRGMGEELQQFSPTGEVGLNFIEPNRPTRLYAMGTVPANTQMTLTCYADDASKGKYTTPYTRSGRFSIEHKVDGIQGQQIFVGLSGASMTQVKIRALGVEIAKRKIDR